MSKAAAKDVIVKLIVGAGQASPSPPVGPALGSKGVKSMDFCKVSQAVVSTSDSTSSQSANIRACLTRNSMQKQHITLPALRYQRESRFVLIGPSISKFVRQRLHGYL